MTDKQKRGHLAAAFCAFVWGTTFISTKVLLKDMSPVQILICRFFIGYIALWIADPHFLKLRSRKHELLFAAAGATGVAIYYYCENIALTYTMASNASIIVSTAPFFTAILAHFFLKNEKIRVYFIIGFAMAMTGIALVSLNGRIALKLNPFGDLLCVFAAIVWAVYSVAVKKIGVYQYPVVASTRRIFFYGILLMLPFTFGSGPIFPVTRDVLNVKIVLNLLFLGVFACAVCFAAWNYAVDALGAVVASNYIYAIPVITVAVSFVILDEPVTFMAVIGIVLTILGLMISSKT